MPTQAQVHTKNIQSGHKVIRQFQEVITQKVAIKFFLHINMLLLKLFVVGGSPLLLQRWKGFI